MNENKSENFIDHEVRIRLLENIAKNIDKRFDAIDLKIENMVNKLEHKMDTQFHWVLGTFIAFTLSMATLFGGIILHLAKII